MVLEGSNVLVSALCSPVSWRLFSFKTPSHLSRFLTWAFFGGAGKHTKIPKGKLERMRRDGALLEAPSDEHLGHCVSWGTVFAKLRKKMGVGERRQYWRDAPAGPDGDTRCQEVVSSARLETFGGAASFTSESSLI